MLQFSQLRSFFFLSQAADLVIQLSSTSRIKDAMVTADKMPFGTVFTDHMLTIEWNATEGWQTPHIKPLGNLSLHPACSSLHYGIQAQDLNFNPTSYSFLKGEYFQFSLAIRCQTECCHAVCFCSSYQVFEGLKLYRGDDKQLRLFRPMLNMNRMSSSATRACLPVSWSNERDEGWSDKGTGVSDRQMTKVPYLSLSSRLLISQSCWSVSGD